MIDPNGAAPLGRGDRPGAGNGIAVAAISCGLVALLFAWMPVLVVVGIVLGVLGLVFGIRGRRRARDVGSGDGMALTGIVSGSAALALSIVGIVFTVSLFREVIDFVEPGAFEAHVVSCDVGPGAIDVEASLTNQSDELRSYTVYGVVSQPRGVPDLVATLDRRGARRDRAGDDAPHGALDRYGRVRGATGRARAHAVRSRHGSRQ